MLSLTIILITFIHEMICSLNLIRNGDFEAFANLSYMNVNLYVSGYHIIEKFLEIPSNQSCWYDKSLGAI